MSKLLGVDVTRVSTEPLHELGMEVEDSRGGQGTITQIQYPNGIPTPVTVTRNYSGSKRYKYVRADAAIAAGDAVMPKFGEADDPNAVVKTADATSFGQAIAETAMAANDYGWITIHGYVVDANVADAVAAGAFLAPSATAGRLDAFTFTTTAATLAQLLAGGQAFLAGIQAVTDGSASNRASVFIHGN